MGEQQRLAERGHLENRERARQHLMGSCFPQLCQDLTEIDSRIVWYFSDNYKFFLDDFHYDGVPQLSEDSASIVITLEEKYKKIDWKRGVQKSFYDLKMIFIEGFSDGRIIVHGNHSESFSFNHWRENSRVQEEALGKAYNSPRKVSKFEAISEHPLQG